MLERSPPTRELSRAYSEQGSLATMAFRFDDGVACADRAIRSAETIHDAGARAHALVTKGMAIATIQYPVASNCWRRASTSRATTGTGSTPCER